MKIFSSVSILNLYFFAFHFRSTIHLQFTFGDDVREESGLIFLPIWISVYWEDYIYCTTLFHKWRSICDLSSSWLCQCSNDISFKFLISYRSKPSLLLLFKRVWTIWGHFAQRTEKKPQNNLLWFLLQFHWICRSLWGKIWIFVLLFLIYD